MKRLITIIFSCVLIAVAVLALSASAAGLTHTVVPDDSMWKIAVKYEVGLSEIIQANPQIKNPALIYPGQRISIPDIGEVKSIEEEVIRLVNQERAKRGLPAFKANWELSRVARYKSQDMIDRGYFDHNSPTYGSPFTMMKSFGIRYSAAAENIAMGQRTPAEVMNAWVNSIGHRNNILSRSTTEIGVGIATNSRGVKYWTQMFIRPM